jgi:anti-anti-sigma regulatory factor
MSISLKGPGQMNADRYEEPTRPTAAAKRDPEDTPAAATAPLPAILDLSLASTLKDLLAASLEANAAVVDAAAVERMSTPCAQIFLAAGRAADLAGITFKITNASVAFRTAVADLGLQTDFTKWMV